MPFPFEVPFDDVEDNLDTYVTEIFSCLQSEFLTLPKGPGFVEYSAFMGRCHIKQSERENDQIAILELIDLAVICIRPMRANILNVTEPTKV